jgi:hypothetical protein
LIEFALAIPVFIAVLYYLHDAPKAKRINAKVDFCLYCAVNMLQNISQERENKRILLRDFAYIFGAATPVVRRRNRSISGI